MDPIRSDDRPAPRRTHVRLRRLLLLPLTAEGVRIIDIVILPIGVVVAFFVCIPILIVTTIVGVGVGLLLEELGAATTISGLASLAGFVGGIALSFVVLLRLYRRLPSGIRSWVTPEDDDDGLRASVLDRDPDADAATFDRRIAAADANLAPRPVGSDPDDPTH